MIDTTVIYLRVSKEDELNKDESNSISNQRIMLMKYISEHEDLAVTEVIEIKDDGYSGKNMQRPGMNKLLEMIRKGQVQNIVVKDFSRFSRDYIELGKYTEQIFPRLGIRFIAVNDNHDSNDYSGGVGGIDSAFKTLLYDYFSEDLSLKVRTALRSKRESGKYIASYAPYGYRKNPEDKYSLEVDPNAAEYVIRIFNEYANGDSMYGISKRLNAEEVPAPIKYIQERDGKVYSRYGETARWTNTALRGILSNETYTGSIVYDKYEDADVAKHATRRKSSEEWIRIENAHEAIISRELFDKVQLRLAKNKKKKSYNEPSIFKGKIICGGCGYKMQLSRKGKSKFYCKHKYDLTEETGVDKCANAIREEDIKSSIIAHINEQLKKIDKAESLDDRSGACLNEKGQASERQLKSMNQSLNKLYQDQVNLYEAYRDGRISKDVYLSQKQLIDSMIEQLSVDIKELEVAISKEKSEEIKYRLPADVEELNAESLNREVIEALVDRIIIGADKTVKVIWKFNNQDYSDE